MLLDAEAGVVAPPPATPLDLLRVYLTPQRGVGQRLRLDTIQRRLSDLPLVPTLVVLAQLAYWADEMIAKPTPDQFALAERVLPAGQARRAKDALQDPHLAVLSSQAVVTLAVHALVCCSETGSIADENRHIRQVGGLAVAMAGLLEVSATEEDLLLDLLRSELWFRLRDLDQWYEVGHRLLFEFLPTMVNRPDWIDHRALVESASGMTLERFMALTTTMGVQAGAPQSHLFPHYIEGNRVPREDVDRWTALFTMPLPDARAAARHDILDTKGWSFTTFWDRPLLDIGGSRRLAIRPWFVALKGTPTGYYNLVERLLGPGSEDTLQWSRLFGGAVEVLGRRLAKDHLGTLPRLNDEDAIRQRWGPGKACDLVVLGDRWLAVDFVHRRISKPTATTGSVSDLAKDLRVGVVDKLEQLDATLERGIATDGPPPAGAYPLVVAGAPFPANGLVVNELDRLIDQAGPQVIGVHGSCRPPTVMDLGEFWLLLEAAAANNVHPADLLERWISSSLAMTSFRNWLVTVGPGRPPLTTRRYWTHALSELFDEEPATALEQLPADPSSGNLWTSEGHKGPY